MGKPSGRQTARNRYAGGGLAKAAKSIVPMEDVETKDDWEPLKRYHINRLPVPETGDKFIVTPEAAREYQDAPYDKFKRGGRRG